MISLFDAADARLALTYNSLTLNNPADAVDDSIEVNDWAIRQTIDFVQDANQNTDGLEAYDPRKQGTLLVLAGRALAPTQAKLMDRLKLMASTFDPVLVNRNNPSVNGFIPLDFSTLTNDTGNYATGKVPARYYARPRVSLALTSPQGKNAMLWRAELLLRDSRRYLQSTSSANLTANTTNSVSNALADYPSWPTFTFTATGAGPSNVTLAKGSLLSSTPQIVLDLSGLINTDVVVVDMEKRTIVKNSIPAMNIYVSGSFFDLSPGNNNITTNSLTNLTVSVAWRPAFSL